MSKKMIGPNAKVYCKWCDNDKEFKGEQFAVDLACYQCMSDYAQKLKQAAAAFVEIIENVCDCTEFLSCPSCQIEDLDQYKELKKLVEGE